MLVESFYDRSGYKFHIVDVFNKKVVRTFYPITNRVYMVGFSETMTRYKDKILIAECQSNDVLEVTLDGVKVRYTININDKMPPKGFWDQKAYGTNQPLLLKGTYSNATPTNRPCTP